MIYLIVYIFGFLISLASKSFFEGKRDKNLHPDDIFFSIVWPVFAIKIGVYVSIWLFSRPFVKLGNRYRK